MSVMDTQAAEHGEFCDCIGLMAEGADHCPDCGREYGLPIQITTDDYGVTFTPFEPTTTEPSQLGGEVLCYVLAHGHTIGIALRGLRFARIAAVKSMHGRGSDDPRVINVTKALDAIDRAIRSEEAAERVTVEVQVGQDRPDDRPRGNRAEEIRPKPKSPIGPMPSEAIKF